jgi:hypothetical protein
MGIDTHWLDNRDNVDPSFFDDSIVITEQWLTFANWTKVSHGLPLRKTSCYLVHYLGNKGPVEGNPGASMYLGKVGKLIDFRFTAINGWGANGVLDKNYEYAFIPSKYEGFNSVSFYERGDDYDNFYTIWATDLLPHEIDFEARFTPQEKNAFFCGTIREDNHLMFKGFMYKCIEHNVPFLYNTPNENPLSTEQIRKHVVSSMLPLDVRPANHLANGYIACRPIKNVSYGALPLTNSSTIYDFFEGSCAYAQDSGDLFDVAMEMQRQIKTKDMILEQMKRVKAEHTYVNRIEDIIRAAEM